MCHHIHLNDRRLSRSFMQVRLYEKQGTSICAAFLTNNSTKGAHTVKFRGDIFYLPPRSISILPDCKNVVYNTQIVSSYHLHNLQFIFHKKKASHILSFSLSQNRLYHNIMQGTMSEWKKPKILNGRCLQSPFQMSIKWISVTKYQMSSMACLKIPQTMDGTPPGNFHGSNLSDLSVSQHCLCRLTLMWLSILIAALN